MLEFSTSRFPSPHEPTHNSFFNSLFLQSSWCSYISTCYSLASARIWLQRCHTHNLCPCRRRQVKVSTYRWRQQQKATAFVHQQQNEYNNILFHSFNSLRFVVFYLLWVRTWVSVCVCEQMTLVPVIPWDTSSNVTHNHRSKYLLRCVSHLHADAWIHTWFQWDSQSKR